MSSKRKKLLVIVAAAGSAALILGLWLAVIAQQATRQASTVAALRELGGIVVYDFQLPEADPAMSWNAMVRSYNGITDRKNAPDLNTDGLAWLRKLVGPDYLGDAVVVNLAYFEDENDKHHDISGIEDTDLHHLQDLSNLRLLLVTKRHATNTTLSFLGLARNPGHLALLAIEYVNEDATKRTANHAPHRCLRLGDRTRAHRLVPRHVPFGRHTRSG